MQLVDVNRFIKIQVLKLKQEGFTSKEIARYLRIFNGVINLSKCAINRDE